MILVFVVVAGSLAMLALAARPLARYRARRLAQRADRRTSFQELLDQAERERIARQVEAEGDKIPW